MDEKQLSIDIVGLAGALHDIGKMAVGNEILEKPDKLTDEEFDKMKNYNRYLSLYRLCLLEKKDANLEAEHSK